MKTIVIAGGGTAGLQLAGRYPDPAVTGVTEASSPGCIASKH
ncbi:hypothetical protein [Cupriavidus sp. L7L]|nr:hypothetical protein [Cupriavidus sp. L7L]